MKSKCKTTEIKIHAKKTVHPTADSIYEDKRQMCFQNLVNWSEEVKVKRGKEMPDTNVGKQIPNIPEKGKETRRMDSLLSYH